jgi:hypothetical protein
MHPPGPGEAHTELIDKDMIKAEKKDWKQNVAYRLERMEKGVVQNYYGNGYRPAPEYWDFNLRRNGMHDFDERNT